MVNDQLFSVDGSGGLRLAELCQALIIESGMAGLKRGGLLIRDMHQLVRQLILVSGNVLLLLLLRGSSQVLVVQNLL